MNQLSESTAVPCRRSITRTADDLKIKRLVVAVHGVGSQYRYATIQAVASRFAAYCKQPMTLPLGAFHSDRLIRKFDSPELGAYPFGPPPDYTTAFSGLGFAEAFWAEPLISLGGIVAFMILWHLISHLQDYSLWPLVLANAAFLYLWWLTALLFDLSYIWHQFIRSSRTTKTLQKIRAGVVRTSALKA